MTTSLPSGCPPVRVLVVDDDWDARFLMEHALGRLGVEVTGAPGGPEALTALATEAVPDVVVLDVQMPGIDGWDVLQTIRKNDATATVAVVLCTVKGRPVDTVRAWELGCDGFVTKPFEIDVLVGELCRVLSVAPAERAQVRARCLAEALDRLHATSETR